MQAHRHPRVNAKAALAVAVVLTFALGGCAGAGDPVETGGPGVPSEPPPAEPPPAEGCEGGESYAGTFAAIQALVFERHGCTQAVCHGDAAVGGLDLRPDVAYANLVEAPSTGATFPRVVPGDKDRSFLWQKLAAKTVPGSVQITGAPMPSGLPAIPLDELEALRLWIHSGAPAEGAVAGTEKLLSACLPVPGPITIEPLDPPAPGEGVQFVLPPIPIAAASEQEVCFATYYDVRDRVPPENQDARGRFFRYSGQELRQDPLSHHLVLNYSGVPVEDVHHPAFGGWSCAGGVRAGEVCEPLDPESCGTDGYCRSAVVPGIACIGFGPPSANGDPINFQIGGAQEAQAYQQLHPGVYAQVPMRGIIYWNSHSFNLTTADAVLNGRINFYFADDQRSAVVPLLEARWVFEPNNPPFTVETLCGFHTLPQGARLFAMSSHNHRRGKRFWTELPDGNPIYESVLYNDPTKQAFDPPLEFDAADPEERTLHFCATYNNGVAPDGSPDPEAVTRWSRVPESARRTFGRCTPVACVTGKIGAPCNGEDDDAACDSAPGAGDGWCDACPITGGESTENEMFILLGQYFIAAGYPQPPDDFLPGGIASELAAE
jgi:hypothetical protein